MYDFVLLNEHLSERDQLQVLYPDAVDWNNSSDEQVKNQLAVKLAEGHLFRSDLAVGTVAMQRFLEEMVLYPESPGAGQMAEATAGVDIAEMMVNVTEFMDESGDKSSDELLRETVQMVDKGLREETDGEARWGDSEDVLKQFGADQPDEDT